MKKDSARTEQSLSRIIGDLRECFKANGFVSVQYGAERKRSIDQNAISHSWYEQIATELREDTVLAIKCQCKLQYGVPILRAEDADFRAMYDASIKGRTYEEKLAIMKYLPVTSLMTTAQLSQYLEAMQTAYASRGVYLEFPNAP